MTTTTSYGTWVNHGDHANVTLEATIADAVSNADREWREAMEAAGAFDTIADAYRNAINEALPAGVTLVGNDFDGPASYDGDVEDTTDIAEIIQCIDLFEIIERHGEEATAAAVEAAHQAQRVAADAKRAADAAALARARAVLDVVRLAGSQSEAARRLGLDQSTINKLAKKANAHSA